MRYADNCCTYKEVVKPEHAYIYTGRCMATGKTYSVTVPAAQLFKYRQGAKIQEAFPDMPEGDREFLISGYSPEGWKQIFGEDPNE